jgi:hypothetical protein
LKERLRLSAGTQRSCRLVYLAPGVAWCRAVRSIEEECFTLVSRKLVNGVPADSASVQMTVNLQLPIQIQLLVDELQQPAKTASAQNAPCGPIPLSSVLISVFQHSP